MYEYKQIKRNQQMDQAVFFVLFFFINALKADWSKRAELNSLLVHIIGVSEAF